MAPPYLTGSVYYDQEVGVVDVATMITNIKALALAATPAWTNPAGDTILSPADASGRQMQIAFSRISATNLAFTLTDGQGRTLTRRAQINAAGSTINYYIGQFHMVMDWLNSATPEGILCAMLDESPETQTSHDRWVVATSSRSAADANDAAWIFGGLFVVRSANTFAVLLLGVLAVPYTGGALQSGGIQSRTIGGSNLWVPLISMGDSTVNVYKIFGKLYQCLATKDTYVATGAEVSVPIDQANSVIFKVLDMPAWAPGGTNYHDRLAVRKT